MTEKLGPNEQHYEFFWRGFPDREDELPRELVQASTEVQFVSFCYDYEIEPGTTAIDLLRARQPRQVRSHANRATALRDQFCRFQQSECTRLLGASPRADNQKVIDVRGEGSHRTRAKLREIPNRIGHLLLQNAYSVARRPGWLDGSQFMHKKAPTQLPMGTGARQNTVPTAVGSRAAARRRSPIA